MGMNIGQRVRGAFDALSGNLSASLAANSAADASRDEATQLALAAAGEVTTGLKAQVAALQEAVDRGHAIDPAEFAKIKDAVDSLDAAFPDAEQAPPEEDDIEEPEVTVEDSDGDAEDDVDDAFLTDDDD